MIEINSYIDHTLLKPEATSAQITQLCSEAKEHAFYAVCINGAYISLAKKLLQDSAVKIAVVVGFPLGASSSAVKAYEAKYYTDHGADEIDMVVNIGMIKNQEYAEILNEIKQIKQAIGTKVLKVIIETCLLTEDEIRKMCHIVRESGAEYIKTSTGFNTGGATKENLQIMLDEAQGKLLVKAAGGIKDIDTALAFVRMGVMRLGTSSGVQLLKGLDTTGY